MKSETITTRSEILFLYDITDANPNGDPNDENRPRLDRESGRAKVTDVRLKRTIRDYLQHARAEKIFIADWEKPDGTLKQSRDRMDDFAKKAASKNEKRAAILSACIDLRLFGAAIPLGKGEEGGSITFTGPVQFSMASSLHRVEPRFTKGTSAFATKQNVKQRGFREEHVLPYGLFAFYGIVNHRAAEATKLSREDVEKLYEAIWFGTKGLITRSKIGQRPLLLLAVEYKSENSNSYIGRLDRFLKLKLQAPADLPGDFREEAIRGTEHYEVDLSDLQAALGARKNKIKEVRYAHDTRLRLSSNPTEKEFLGLPAKAFADFD